MLREKSFFLKVLSYSLVYNNIRYQVLYYYSSNSYQNIKELCFYELGCLKNHRNNMNNDIFLYFISRKKKYCNIFKILQYRTTKQYFIAIFHTKQYHIAISYRYQYILQYLNGNQYNIVSNNIAIYCSAIILCGPLMAINGVEILFLKFNIQQLHQIVEKRLHRCPNISNSKVKNPGSTTKSWLDSLVFGSACEYIPISPLPTGQSFATHRSISDNSGTFAASKNRLRNSHSALHSAPST